ncbi:MAG: hypothetical protein Ct9H300mP20_16660 [Gammaproteobacteria bacterium]|nr:MAG: hypothetical protein Ct9H300mP20_16660 [Gammaproteobacteria bacterium]
MENYCPTLIRVSEWIIKHRLEREEKVIEAIKEVTKGNPDTLVEQVYSDVDAALFPIAKWSLEAHLIKLQNEKKGFLRKAISLSGKTPSLI